MSGEEVPKRRLGGDDNDSEEGMCCALMNEVCVVAYVHDLRQRLPSVRLRLRLPHRVGVATETS